MSCWRGYNGASALAWRQSRPAPRAVTAPVNGLKRRITADGPRIVQAKKLLLREDAANDSTPG
jgi:hypothetical protein